MKTFISLKSDSFTLLFKSQKIKSSPVFDNYQLGNYSDVEMSRHKHTRWEAISFNIRVPHCKHLKPNHSSDLFFWQQSEDELNYTLEYQFACTDEKQNPDNRIHSNRHRNVDRWIPAAVMIHPKDTATIHTEKKRQNFGKLPCYWGIAIKNI